jgi:hypothetical protein
MGESVPQASILATFEKLSSAEFAGLLSEQLRHWVFLIGNLLSGMALQPLCN